MTWVEKGQKTSFDELPIHGLFYLDGELLARYLAIKFGNVPTPLFNPDWLKNQKMPQVQFPSGERFDIWEASDIVHGGIIHVYGEMDLPYYDTRDSAWLVANEIAEYVGYIVRKVGESQLEVLGHEADEHYLITYNNLDRRMEDVIQIKLEKNKARDVSNPLLDLGTWHRLPKLYANEHLGLAAFAQVKFFTSASDWTWYASEAVAAMKDGTYKALSEISPDDPQIEDVIFFGLVDGFELEFGYFSLEELKQIGKGLKSLIERDRNFVPATLKDIQDKHRKMRSEF